MSDTELEQKIVDAGCVAPRVTQKRIESVIEAGAFIKLPRGTTLLCELTLVNGFSLRGESSCVDPANFRQDIGETISHQKAMDQIWPFEGYLLAQRIHEGRYILSDAELDLPSFHQRLLCERGDLANNLSKLTAYLASPASDELPTLMYDLMVKQEGTQAELLDLLDARLKLLEA